MKHEACYRTTLYCGIIQLPFSCNVAFFHPAAFSDIDLMGTASLDELRQLRSVDGNFGPHIHAPQRVISF